MAGKESGKLNCLIYARKQRQYKATLEDRINCKQAEGKLPDPKTLSAWTHNVSKIPEFPFGDPLQLFGR